jgi:formylglycine-generating enzyme required for sulfatase activity
MRILLSFVVGSCRASVVRCIGCVALWLISTGNAFAQNPSNNNFGSRTLLSGNSVSAIGSNANATAEAGEPFPAVGRDSVWWSWTAPSSGTAILRTFNSKFDTVLAVYTGTSVSSLTMVGSNDDDATTLQSHLEIPVTEGVQYQIQVSSHDGQAGPISLSIAYVNTAAPDSISLSKSWMDETASTGVTVATLGSTDPDAGDVAVFSLVPGEGAEDNESFTVSGNQLRTKSSVLYDSKRTVSIRVRVTDRGGLSFAQSFSMVVVPEAPHAEFVKKSVTFTQQPNYVNSIFQLIGKENGKAINYPREFFDPGSESYRPELFRAFEAASVAQAATPISLQESYMQVAKLDEVTAKVRTVLLLDNSRSLALADLAAIKEAAKEMVDLMFDRQEIAVYSFAGSVNRVADFTGNSPQNKAALKSAIDTITRSTSNTTNLYGGIVQMLGIPEWKESFSPNGIETGFLVALTDGEDTSGSANREDVINLRDYDDPNDSFVGTRSIYTVGLGASIDEAVLTDIGNAGYYPVEEASSLAAKFVEIQRDIIDQANSYYWVNYSSPKRRSNPQGQLRQLELRLLNNTNTGPDGVLRSTFLSDTFIDLDSALFINRSADKPAGDSVLNIPRDTLSTASAFTIYPPLDFSSYRWTIGNPLLAEIVETSEEGDRVVIKPSGRNGTTTLTVTDVVSNAVGDFTKEITLVIGTGVNPSTQIINFAALPDKSPSSLPFQLGAFSTSGLPVSFHIVTGPATVSGSTVTLTGGTGIVTVRASQAGNETHYAAPEVTRTFNVALDPLAGFLSAAEIPADKQGPLDDPDRDGVSNILEYAFNLNPASPVEAVPMAAGGLSGLPRITANANGVPPGFQMEYLRRKGGGLLYTPEVSNDLKAFTPMPGVPAVSSINAEWERVNFTESSPPAEARRFARVRVSSAVAPGAPAITVPPVPTQMHTGKTATLRVEASGSGLSYQWYCGNLGDTSSPVGTNSSSFTTPALSATTAYWVRITNASGRTDSRAVPVTVTQPVIVPVIIAQPSSIGIPYATSKTLSVLASGSNPMTYQWYQGASGTTTTPVGDSTKNFVTPILTSAESYWVRVSNAAGSEDSSTATLTMAPNITVQPESITISHGQNITLSVTATGPGPLSYRWYRGSRGDTATQVGSASSFTTPLLSADTSYWVRVSNAAGAADSSTAKVSLRPVITSQPEPSTIGSGQAATLSVTVAGPEPLVYQWYQGGLGVTSTPVGTNSTTFTTPRLSANTTYWVRVRNNSGSVDSLAASVYVRPSITIQPISTSVSSGRTATLSVSATGPGQLSYQWYQGAFGTTTSPVGTNTATYTTPALTDTAIYWVRVSNSAGSVDSSTATIAVGPSINTQPASMQVASGSTAKLDVAATGTAPLTYQWYQGNSGDTASPVGGNSTSFTTTALINTGFYWVRVSNSAGSVDSSTAVITVGPSLAVQPASTPITSGSTATLTVTASGTAPLTYQWYQGAVGTMTTPVGSNSVSFVTPALTVTTSYWVRVTNSVGSVDSRLSTVTVATPPSITTEPTSTTIRNGLTATLAVTVGSTAPLTYQWYQGALGVSTTPVGTNSASFTTPVLTVTTTYWVRVSNMAGSVNSGLATVTVAIPPTITTQPASKTIASGQTASLQVFASGTDPLTYQWYEGAVGTTTTPVGTNSNSFTTPALTVTTSYWVRVSNTGGSVNSGLATVSTKPSVTTEPASTTISSGQTATLAVTASGTAPLAYQWYQGEEGTTTTPVGTNSALFTTPALTVTTSYWVRVSNTEGSVNSSVATVTVATQPTITTQPASTKIISGQTATLTVGASNTTPLMYQWYQGAVGTTVTPVGTSSASFTTPILTGNTTYWVRVSNPVGSANSSLAIVTVTSPPTAPTGLSLIPGGSFTMGGNPFDTFNAPSVTVAVSAFYMAQHEVTKALWDEVRIWASSNGYFDLAVGGGKAPNHPVQRITWFDMVKWCNARSQRDGLTPCYYDWRGLVMKSGSVDPTVNWSANGYRLPTEAEWEKAARGGVGGKSFPWGTDTISHSQANYYASSSFGFDSSGSVNNYHPTYATGSWPYTSPVGAFAANGYGLYDMAGNVFEGCWDWSGSTYVNGATDPRGAPSGTARVSRGGSWDIKAPNCLVASRMGFNQASSDNDFGFRVVRSSVP